PCCEQILIFLGRLRLFFLMMTFTCIKITLDFIFNCQGEQELSKVAHRKLASHYPQPPEPRGAVAHDSPFACPLDLYMPWDLKERSLSPWRYVSKPMKDHYPSTYVEAQCLCSGCIMIKNQGTPELSHDYNSVPLTQTRVFLKRERCTDEQKYYLKPVSVVVTVGCTCARPHLV
uniref:Interleukin 17c n=1 Tax=Hippocampus comes TaxID=109280 RepID=A0A3Q2YF27_HIPCM